MELRPMKYFGQKGPAGFERPPGYFECPFEKQSRAGAVGDLYAGGRRGHIAEHDVERDMAAKGGFNEFQIKNVALQSHYVVWKRVFDRLEVDPHNQSGVSNDPARQLNP